MECSSNGNIIISHATSAAYWRYVGSAHACNLKPCVENPLEDCAPSVAGSNGAAKTEKAAGFALEHARSPMEIKAGPLKSLPRSLGGFQFPRPVLNHKVSCEELRSAVEQDYFLVDIAYPTRRIGVEYFGCDTHPDSVADRRRINGLRALGWEILTLDQSQLYDPAAFMVFARQLSILLEHEIKTSPEWLAKHMRLRADLDLVRPSL